MIDFETFDNKPTSAVVSVGVVLFTNTKIIGKKYWVFKLEEQFKAGRTVSESTLRWWLSQSKESKKVFDIENLEKGAVKWFTLDEFLIDFEGRIGAILKKTKENWDSVNVWGNGSIFDIAIFEDIYRQIDRPIPWKFWNIIDFRTLDRLSGIKSFVKREGVHHNALDDSIYQAKCVIEYFKKVKEGALVPKIKENKK